MLLAGFSIQQDTVPHKIRKDSLRVSQDSGTVVSGSFQDTSKHKSVSIHRRPVFDNSDTSSVCTRNSIADITFYNRDNFLFRNKSRPFKQFPFIFTEKVRQYQAQEKATLIRSLKDGTERPVQPLHADWIIIVVLTSAFLFLVVKKSYGRFSSGFMKSFLLRGASEPASRDLGGLFHWQSTVINLASFIIIGLFSYTALSYYEILPAGRGIVIWLVSLLIISAAVTLRHFVCLATGSLSGQAEVFREYLLGIYQTYRIGALFLFVIIILVSYTTFLPPGGLIISGIAIAGIIYLIRVIRLTVIFINRNISIFYLILYLCALEILPVLVIAKYITGQ